LPRVISASIEAWVGLSRIEELLFADELEKVVVERDAEFAISVDEGEFAWEVSDKVEEQEKTEEKFQLQKAPHIGFLN
jgi:hypothetical protein